MISEICLPLSKKRSHYKLLIPLLCFASLNTDCFYISAVPYSEPHLQGYCDQVLMTRSSIDGNPPFQIPFFSTSLYLLSSKFCAQPPIAFTVL